MEVQEVWVKETVCLHEIRGYEIDQSIFNNLNPVLGLNMENVLWQVQIQNQMDSSMVMGIFLCQKRELKRTKECCEVSMDLFFKFFFKFT